MWGSSGCKLETYYRQDTTLTIVSQVFESMNTLRLRDFAFMVFSVSQYPHIFLKSHN
ncbi:MAG: hypothetical protein BMS9Abin11_1199 [Gammaproteobacteria bacterium]|nr:MAG: hypothetical protein BMS9Abin11_1199 [Gammaproteobacteria bacterium]